MVDRLAGYDTVDGFLPEDSKMHAEQIKLLDVAGNFAATDVESALAEIGRGGGTGSIATVNGDPGPNVLLDASEVGAVASSAAGDAPQARTIVTYSKAAFAALAVRDPHTFYIVYDPALDGGSLYLGDHYVLGNIVATPVGHAPTLTSVSPASITVGATGTLTLTGSGFAFGSVLVDITGFGLPTLLSVTPNTVNVGQTGTITLTGVGFATPIVEVT